MTPLIIDKKKYVLVLEKDYKILQRKAVLNMKSEKTYSLAEAKKISKKMIRKKSKNIS